jgi:hypothetical protein
LDSAIGLILVWFCGVSPPRRNKEISVCFGMDSLSDSIDPGDFGTGIWSFDEMVLLAGISGNAAAGAGASLGLLRPSSGYVPTTALNRAM